MEKERFIAKEYSERIRNIFRIYSTVSKEYVKIGKEDDLLCSTKEDAQAVCDVLNKVEAF